MVMRASLGRNKTKKISELTDRKTNQSGLKQMGKGILVFH